MYKFSDFKIQPETKGFTGDKIKIDRIINRPIVVLDYKIEESKFEGKGKRLDLQIEVNGNKHVVFTSSRTLLDMITKVPKEKMPFTTTIEKADERYQFT